jgi:hypothetical protein
MTYLCMYLNHTGAIGLLSSIVHEVNKSPRKSYPRLTTTALIDCDEESSNHWGKHNLSILSLVVLAYVFCLPHGDDLNIRIGIIIDHNFDFAAMRRGCHQADIN